jgi:hypothetical protein
MSIHGKSGMTTLYGCSESANSTQNRWVWAEECVRNFLYGSSGRVDSGIPLLFFSFTHPLHYEPYSMDSLLFSELVSCIERRCFCRHITVYRPTVRAPSFCAPTRDSWVLLVANIGQEEAHHQAQTKERERELATLGENVILVYGEIPSYINIYIAVR